MNWLIWRQYRKQWFVFVGLLIIFALVALPSGLHFWHDYLRLSAVCRPNNSCNLTDLRDSIFNNQYDGLIVDAIKLTLLGVPFLLGLFWGVPLLAKEYTDKTNMFVWTQSISRKQWLSVKIAWVLGATVVYVGILSAIATWFSKTGNTVNLDRFEVLAFDSQGIVPIAIAVFAVSLGILFGAWFKKVIPALGATLGLLLVIQVAVPLFARTQYMAPKVYASSSLLSGDHGDPFRYTLPNSDGLWVVREQMVDPHGNVFEWTNPPRSCKLADPAAGKGDTSAKRRAVIARNNTFIDVDCLNALGYHWEVKYQPSYRYWDFQRIESGLYIALSLAALGATYGFVLKRDA